MKFVVDENLPRRFADLLRNAGHDATHAVDHGLAGAVDEMVMALALDEQAVLVTYDADFAAMLVLGGRRLPSVVLFATSVADRTTWPGYSSRISRSSNTRCPKVRSSSSTQPGCGLEAADHARLNADPAENSRIDG